jgi:hypothetical protein
MELVGDIRAKEEEEEEVVGREEEGESEEFA